MDRTQIVRAAYDAYAAGDRAAMAALITDDYAFSSPVDVGLDRAAYFERCWPEEPGVSGFELVRCVEAGDEVVVTYVATRADGTRFRNTEVHTLRGDRLRAVEVYFGWDLG